MSPTLKIIPPQDDRWPTGWTTSQHMDKNIESCFRTFGFQTVLRRAQNYWNDWFGVHERSIPTDNGGDDDYDDDGDEDLAVDDDDYDGAASVHAVAWLRFFLCSFIRSFILKTYIAPLQETTTQRRSQPSHGQKRKTWERLSVVTGTGVHTPEAPPQSSMHSSDEILTYRYIEISKWNTNDI